MLPWANTVRPYSITVKSWDLNNMYYNKYCTVTCERPMNAPTTKNKNGADTILSAPFL